MCLTQQNIQYFYDMPFEELFFLASKRSNRTTLLGFLHIYKELIRLS